MGVCSDEQLGGVEEDRYSLLDFLVADLLADALVSIHVGRLDLDDPERDSVDEQYEVHADRSAAGIRYGIFARNLEGVRPPVLPVNVLERPLTRSLPNPLR